MKSYYDAEVWIVGSYPDDDADPWMIQGVYSTKEYAELHAQPGWFIGSVQLDTPLPERALDWPGAFIVEEA